MSDTASVDVALERFESAMQQLEAAMAAVEEKSRAALAVTADADSLRESKERLQRELEEVKARSRVLADQNRLALKRIDQAMARIRRVLGEPG